MRMTHVEAFTAVGYQLIIRPADKTMVTATKRRKLRFILVVGEIFCCLHSPVTRGSDTSKWRQYLNHGLAWNRRCTGREL